MAGSYDSTAVSYELCDRVVEAVDVTGAGVSIVDDNGSIKFVTATSELIVQMEEAQEKAQEWPCVAAFQSQRSVAVEEISATHQWDTYRSVAERLNLRAVVGFPLSAGGQRIGALNVYKAEPYRWTEDDLDLIGVFADMATAYLVRTAEMAEARQLADQLQEALDSRIVVEQAKGILANEYGISVDEAFEILRSRSRSNQVKLKDIAEAVVRMGMRLPRGS